LLECGDSLLSPFLSGDDSFSGTQETRKITLLRLSAEAWRSLRLFETLSNPTLGKTHVSGTCVDVAEILPIGKEWRRTWPIGWCRRYSSQYSAI